MIPLKILANVHFFECEKEKKCKSGIDLSFSIRKDMFNCGKMVFIDKDYAISGDENISAYIYFLYSELVLPFISEGFRFTFESTKTFGEGVVLKILEYNNKPIDDELNKL
jgi:hypothetical protein